MNTLRSTAMAALAASLCISMNAFADVCEVPDNGSGTVDLPPPGCGYVSPDDLHIMIGNLPAGTQINVALDHMKFFQVQTFPGGNLGGEVEIFNSILFMDMEGVGDLAGFNRSIFMQVQCEVHTGPRNAGDPLQTFPNEMVILFGELFGDPDFDQLRVSAGIGQGLPPSTGQTTLTDLGNGSFNVDSFFDIAYRIEFVGAPGSILDGFGGTTDGIAHMQAGEPALGPPPVGLAINEIRTDQPGGDSDEYVEITGPPGTLLDNVSYVVLGDTGSGTIEAVVDLSGSVIPPDGHFLAAEASFTGDITQVDLTTNLNFENSDNVTHLLVFGLTAGNGDDVDPDDDCTQDVFPWAAELDRIALVEEPNPPASTECHYGPPSIGPDGSFVPGHVYRCEPDGTWLIGPFDPVGGADTPGIPNPGCPVDDPCPADTNGDGVVNVDDLVNVILLWGTPGVAPGVDADVNNDGVVNVDDLVAVITGWGPCPCPNVDYFATIPDSPSALAFDGGDIPPIPAGFFGPGSDPFFGIVGMRGCLGGDPALPPTADTCVQRSGPIDLTDAPIGTAQTVDVEIVSLNLTGIQPLVVTFNGGQNPDPWVVSMGLSDQQQPGQLTAQKTHPQGGVTEATVPVSPRLVFAREQELQMLEAGLLQPEDVQIRVLDFNVDKIPPVPMQWTPDVGYPFSTVPPTDGSFFCPGETFFPGVNSQGGTANADLPPHVPPNSPGAAHFVCPPPPPPPGLCTYALMGVTPCIGGVCPPGSVCLAPPEIKCLILCPQVPGCPAPCPPFVMVALPCPGAPGCFCVGFYQCIGCLDC